MLKAASQDAIMYVSTPFTSIPDQIIKSGFLSNAYYKVQCSDCTDCIDCSFCSNCSNCEKCEQCSNMTNCTNCQNCSNMVNCTNCKNCSNLKAGAATGATLGIDWPLWTRRTGTVLSTSLDRQFKFVYKLWLNILLYGGSGYIHYLHRLIKAFNYNHSLMVVYIPRFTLTFNTHH